MTGESIKDVRMQWAAFASIGAGVIHGTAVGLHADHLTLSRVFLVLALLQVAWGVVALQRTQIDVVLSGLLVNGAAAIGWLLTRTTGIAFVSGLELSEKPQPADTLGAVLAVASVAAAVWAWRKRGTPSRPTSLVNAVYICSALTVVALWSVTGHAHSDVHDVALTDAGLTINADGAILSPTDEAPVGLETSTTAVATTSTMPSASASATATKEKASSSSVPVPRTTAPAPTVANTTATTVHPHSLTTAQLLAKQSGWPRAWDGSTIDFSGIGGVTTEQSARATTLIQSTIRDTAKYASTQSAKDAGYSSIADQASGFGHYIHFGLIRDGKALDSTAPESLVYSVVNGVRTLVSVMYIANPNTALTDTTLVNYAGGLMQWHVHRDLCWELVGGSWKVVAVTNFLGLCSKGVVDSTGAPMVHVWVTPHPCGPFAAVEGVGAGIAQASDSERVDMCSQAH
jgi:hypothetical protein